MIRPNVLSLNHTGLMRKLSEDKNHIARFRVIGTCGLSTVIAAIYGGTRSPSGFEFQI